MNEAAGNVVADTEIAKVIRLEPFGPNAAGLAPMTLDPADFESDLPEQAVHVYFEDEDLGMSVGVWDTSTMQEAWGPYPGDEFILVLEGGFRMLDAESDGVPATKGQSVIFRNGVPVSWKQDGFLKKFYITYMDPRAETPEGLSPKGGIQTLDPTLTLTDADLIEGQDGQREKIFFTNDHGNMEVGLWDSPATTSDMFAFPTHEFVQMLEGEVTIEAPDGTSQTFVAGDVFFIPHGTVSRWHIKSYVRKFFAAIDPTIRPGS